MSTVYAPAAETPRLDSFSHLVRDAFSLCVKSRFYAGEQLL